MLNGLGQSYVAQQQQLGDDWPEYFVASYMLGRTDGWPGAISLCSWGHAVPALLPETDLITLADWKKREVVGLADFGTVREVVGDLMTPLGVYPERYKVTAFPSAEQLDAIAQRPRSALLAMLERSTISQEELRMR
jgi:hypothetical protein